MHIEIKEFSCPISQDERIGIDAVSFSKGFPKGRPLGVGIVDDVADVSRHGFFDGRRKPRGLMLALKSSQTFPGGGAS